MKFLEIVQESLLGLSIVIMLPAITYWGINTFNPAPKMYEIEKTEKATTETQAAELKQTQELKEQWEKHRHISFWIYLIVALLAISIGAFLKVYSLSIGFIGGGVLNLLMSIFHNPNTPGINFVIFLSLLVFLIFIIMYRKKVIQDHLI